MNPCSEIFAAVLAEQEHSLSAAGHAIADAAPGLDAAVAYRERARLLHQLSAAARAAGFSPVATAAWLAAQADYRNAAHHVDNSDEVPRQNLF